MIDFLKRVIESIGDGWFESIVAVLILLIVLGLIGLISYGLFIAIDSWFLPRNHDKGKIVSKTFTPAHIQTIWIFNAATKTNMPQLISYPDDWSVRVEIEEKQGSISISKKFYDSLKEDDQVMTEYVIGRFSKNIYIKSISLS